MKGVAVLICTYNGAARLPETLRHLAQQRVAAGIRWEVVLVSNASTDDTLAVAPRLWAALGAPAPLRVLDEPQAGKEHALVRGFAAAAYEFMAVVDDDNWLAPGYVQRAYEVMSAHPEIGILGAHGQGAFEVPPPVWFAQFEAVYAVGPQNGGQNGPLPDKAGYLYGAGSVVRQTGWRKLLAYGFAFTTSAKRGEVLSGAEDIELGDALRLAGYKLWYDDELRFQHFMYKERLTWEYLLRMARSTASSQLTSVVYYFIFRHPNLTETRFRQLYAKRILWLSTQVAKKPGALVTALSRPNDEHSTRNFETLRLLYNLKTSVTQRTAAVQVFRQVRALQQRLADLERATKSTTST
ncbi:glycosyltransferase [Hymenobacter sp. PAMC 26628]|uniref:glycosyltransferase n=1 Tax=Hymenobacter sp. PAMC 26628 TaxID=1484118 RepID=UPI000B0E3D8B|nr:glycosyltransferase [Hymenobacter sp. PAMC 26628]